MLDNKGFDLWASSYDQTVKLSDEQEAYPFAGYEPMMEALYEKVCTKDVQNIVDLGVGTGKLTKRLYDAGHHITGIDFSEEMLKIARDKMPKATFIEGDLHHTSKLITNQKFDVIISTYAMHHLTDDEKVKLLRELLTHLNEGGAIYIGDISFETHFLQSKCRKQHIDEWDDSEYYFIVTKLLPIISTFVKVQFKKYAHCCGLWTIQPR